MDTNTNQSDTDELAGELLVGKDAIQAFLEYLGMPEGTDPYYLRRTGWPIGKTRRRRRRKPHRHQTPPYPPAPKSSLHRRRPTRPDLETVPDSAGPLPARSSCHQPGGGRAAAPVHGGRPQ